MATNFKNDSHYIITNEKQTIPASADVTGTIETVGIYIVGTGTKFLTESDLMMDGWLADLPNDEIRKVKSVFSDTRAELCQAFTVDITAGTTPNVIDRVKLNIRQISVSIDPSLTNGEIDNVPLLAGASITFGKTSDTKRDSFSFIDPLIANATGTEMEVTILK